MDNYIILLPVLFHVRGSTSALVLKFVALFCLMRLCKYVKLEIIYLKQNKSCVFPINFNQFRTEIAF